MLPPCSPVPNCSAVACAKPQACGCRKRPFTFLFCTGPAALMCCLHSLVCHMPCLVLMAVSIVAPCLASVTCGILWIASCVFLVSGALCVVWCVCGKFSLRRRACIFRAVTCHCCSHAATGKYMLEADTPVGASVPCSSQAEASCPSFATSIAHPLRPTAPALAASGDRGGGGGGSNRVMAGVGVRRDKDEGAADADGGEGVLPPPRRGGGGDNDGALVRQETCHVPRGAMGECGSGGSGGSVGEGRTRRRGRLQNQYMPPAGCR